jgi:hypothetical protein
MLYQLIKITINRIFLYFSMLTSVTTIFDTKYFSIFYNTTIYIQFFHYNIIWPFKFSNKSKYFP